MENKYYDFPRIFKKDRKWNMIMGVRGNGKSYGAKKHCLERYFNHQEQFIWVRRTKTQLEPTANSWLADMVNDETITSLVPKGFGLKTSKKHIMLYKLDNSKVKVKDVIIGYFIPLTTQQNFKSVSYHNVATVIFDEFLTFEGYLSNELFRFQELMSTIERDRENFKLFLISNNVSIDNIYFNALKIDISKIEPMIPTNFDGIGCVEICDTKSLKLAKAYKKTLSNWFGSKTGYNEYSEKGDWILDDLTFVGKIKGMKKFKYNCVINGVMFGVWEYANPIKKYTIPLLYFSRQVNPDGTTYSLMKQDFTGGKSEITILDGSFVPVWIDEIKSCNITYENMEI